MKITDAKTDFLVTWKPTRLSKNLISNFNTTRPIAGVITGTKGNMVWVNLVRVDGTRVSRLVSVSELSLVKPAPRPRTTTPAPSKGTP